MFEAMPSEGLVPDYDSYSAVILSYLKESVRAYRQFATSHPGERSCGPSMHNTCHLYHCSACHCLRGVPRTLYSVRSSCTL